MKKDPDHIAGLVSEVIPDKSCLIFCSTKKNCESLTNLLRSLLPKRFTEHKLAERETLIKAIENDMGMTLLLRSLYYNGIHGYIRIHFR